MAIKKKFIKNIDSERRPVLIVIVYADGVHDERHRRPYLDKQKRLLPSLFKLIGYVQR